MGKSINEQIEDCKKRLEGYKKVGKTYLITTAQKQLADLESKQAGGKKKDAPS